MRRKDIDTLKDWKRKGRLSAWPIKHDFETIEKYPKEEDCVSTPTEFAQANPVARCRIVSFIGKEAECTVKIHGLELPRVNFPAWILKRKGLNAGSRFHWIMRDGVRIRLADIDAEVPQTDELCAEELAELERLDKEMKGDRAEDCGEWPEYSGSGH